MNYHRRRDGFYYADYVGCYISFVFSVPLQKFSYNSNKNEDKSVLASRLGNTKGYFYISLTLRR
jgi:hypothetical protein